MKHHPNPNPYQSPRDADFEGSPSGALVVWLLAIVVFLAGVLYGALTR